MRASDEPQVLVIDGETMGDVRRGDEEVDRLAGDDGVLAEVPIPFAADRTDDLRAATALARQASSGDL